MTGTRAILRWAVRLFRREWRQQALVLGLLTLVVAAAVAGSAVAANTVAETQPEFGDAPTISRVDATDGQGDARVATARARYGEVEVVGHSPTAVPGSTQPIDLVVQDPNGRFAHSLVALLDGRYPKGSNEVAVTPSVAELLGTKVGQPVELGRVSRTVVGLVENPRQLDQDFGLLDPAAAPPSSELVLYFVGGSGGRVGVGEQAPGGVALPIMAKGDDGPVAVIVLIAATLAMSLVGLVAVAGFVVLAHRRQRQLGLLAAIGASERDLRLVTIATGLIVGVIAAVVGGAIGIVGWIAAAPAVESAANHRIDRLDLPFGLVAACMGLAVLMAGAAAWWPARSTSRLSVVAALSGRPPRPARVYRSLIATVVLLVGGISAIVASKADSDHVRPWFLIGGTLAIIVGVVFATPAAIRTLGAPAARLPFAPRLALRDLVRFQARAAASLAAITLGLGTSVGVIAIAKASEHRTDEGNLSTHQLVIHQAPVSAVSDAGTPAPQTTDGVAAIAAAVPGATVLPLLVTEGAGGAGPGGEPVSVAKEIDEHSFRQVTIPYVATPEVLRHYGIDPSTIAPDTELLTALPGNLRLIDLGGGRPGVAPTKVQVVPALATAYSSAPRAFITEAAMQRRGWKAIPSAWFVEAPSTITTEQLAAARSAAAAKGFEIERRDSDDGLVALRTIAAAVGTLLALAILAMTVGLIRSESVRDLRTLTATGAAAGTRRALTASTSGTLAILGAVLGIGGAYVALVAGFHSDLDRLRPLPLPHLLAIAVGLPILATAGGWLLAGRDPKTFSRQALE